MKRFFQLSTIVAAAVMIAASCEKIPFDNPNGGNGRNGGGTEQPGGGSDKPGGGNQGGGNQGGGQLSYDNPHEGHEWVDLGLSVLWASCNVGAGTPSQTGGFYPWGDERTQSDFAYAWAGYKWYDIPGDALTKYNLNAAFGAVDNKSILDSEDDVARTLWGGSWRMPTKAELVELLYGCTWTASTLDGVKGYKVSSDKTGGSIFLPGAGAWSEGQLQCEGSPAIWSSELDIAGDDEDSLYGFALLYGVYEDNTAGYVRCCGLNVRAVLPLGDNGSAQPGGGNGGGSGQPGGPENGGDKGGGSQPGGGQGGSGQPGGNGGQPGGGNGGQGGGNGGGAPAPKSLNSGHISVSSYSGLRRR